MTPESIVTSVEWSKKLKEAGWDLRTLYFRCRLSDSPTEAEDWILGTHIHSMASELLAAPTAEEILRTFPKEETFAIFQTSLSGGWYIYRTSLQEPVGQSFFEQGSFANAAAAMWLYLKGNNLLSAA